MPQVVDVTALRLSLTRLARRVRKNSAPGLTPSQLSALTTIERHGSTRLGRLAEREHISKSSTTRLVARLEGLGLVARQQDPDDARSWCVDLTTDGAALLRAASDRADEYLARQLSALGPDDRERIASALPALERLLAVKS
ncbi:MAG: MarR family winged helix-turn-helix transcriptional regulator [Jiangellaceae bacterium]